MAEFRSVVAVSFQFPNWAIGLSSGGATDLRFDWVDEMY
jgi:hypothetical protein